MTRPAICDECGEPLALCECDPDASIDRAGDASIVIDDIGEALPVTAAMRGVPRAVEWDETTDGKRAARVGRAKVAPAEKTRDASGLEWDGRATQGLRARVRVGESWVQIKVSPVRRYAGGRVTGWRWSAVCELARAVVEVRSGQPLTLDLAKSRAVEAAPRAASAAELLTEVSR